MDQRETIVVWFSCGAASAVAAKKTIERYHNSHIIRVVNNPVLEEDADNQRFLKDVEKWLGIEIESATNSKWERPSARDVWEKRKYMSGRDGAPCTQQLKKIARQQWESKNHHDHLVMGFTVEEKARHDRFALTERSNVLPVLIEAGLTKEDCFDIIREAGIALPRIYFMGYPNANCVGCVKATSPSYWNHVRKMHPEVFADRAQQSREIGAKLTRFKGRRIFLDDLPADAKGRSLKSMKMPDCGIFCEERS
jgi:hypothetical protein